MGDNIHGFPGNIDNQTAYVCKVSACTRKNDHVRSWQFGLVGSIGTPGPRLEQEVFFGDGQI